MTLINLSKYQKKYDHKFSPVGSKDRPLYKYVYDEAYGCPRRVLNGHYDFHAFIQEGRDSVDFNSLGKILVDTKANIIDHFVSKDGEVVDITGTPRNIHEASKLFNDLKDNFDALPKELKALFDDSFNSFSISYRNGTLGSKFKSFYDSLAPKAPKAPESEVEK